MDPQARLLRFPIATVSQSEGGFERSYQSSVVVMLWDIRLAPGEHWNVRVRLRMSALDAPES